jgi:hypothetical protein
VFAVEIRSTVGLGAKLEWCLEIMAYCNDKGLVPRFRFSYPDSRPAVDYFGSPFGIKDSQDRPARFITIGSIIELDLGEDYDPVLTIGLAHGLLNKHLLVREDVVREDVVREVDEFCRGHFGDRGVVGVHYRGTRVAGCLI